MLILCINTTLINDVHVYIMYIVELNRVDQKQCVNILTYDVCFFLSLQIKLQ